MAMAPEEAPDDLPFVIPFGDAYPQVGQKERKDVAAQFEICVEDTLLKYLGELTTPDLLPGESYTLTELYLRRQKTDTECIVWLGAGIASPSHPRNKSGTNQPFKFIGVRFGNKDHHYILDAGSEGAVRRSDRDLPRLQTTTIEDERPELEDFKQKLKLDGHTEEEIEVLLGELTIKDELALYRRWLDKKHIFDQQMGLNHQPISNPEMNGLQIYIEDNGFEAFTPVEPTFEDDCQP